MKSFTVNEILVELYYTQTWPSYNLIWACMTVHVLNATPVTLSTASESKKDKLTLEMYLICMASLSCASNLIQLTYSQSIDEPRRYDAPRRPKQSKVYLP